jgi:hypothetical protein
VIDVYRHYVITFSDGSWQEKKHFDIGVLFILDHHVKFHFYSASSLNGYVAPLGHIVLIPSQQVNLNEACLAEK